MPTLAKAASTGSEANEKSTDESTDGEIVKVKQQRKRAEYACEHARDNYYAKGYCRSCYHKTARYKRNADKCAHKELLNYAKGYCKTCYISQYRKERKLKNEKDSCKDK